MEKRLKYLMEMYVFKKGVLRTNSMLIDRCHKTLVHHGMFNLRDIELNKSYVGVSLMATRWGYWLHDSLCRAH